MPPDDTLEVALKGDHIDEILAEATPPDYWSDAFIDSISQGHSEDCGLRLHMPAVTFADPTLGEVQGIEPAEAATAEVERFVLDAVSIVRSELPDIVNQQLGPIFGPYIPPPPSPLPYPFPGPFPFPGPLPLPINPFPGQSLARIMLQIGVITGRLAALPPRLTATQPSTPSPPFSPGRDARIQIEVDRDMEVFLWIHSKMTSTYTFGRGQGTSHGEQNPTIAAPIHSGYDRPWFGKALIRESVVDLPVGIPYPMPKARGYWVGQLGVAGELSAVHGGQAHLRSIAHGLDIPVKFNGNYGRLRVILEPKVPCRVVWGDVEVRGPYEEDIAGLEDARFARIEAKRDAMMATLSGLQGTLGLLGSAAGAIPVVGALVDTALQRVAMLIEDKKTALAQAIDSANRAQRRLNYTLAESYPEIGPVGGAEDQPRP